MLGAGDWGCETESDGTSTEFLLQIKDRQKEVGNILKMRLKATEGLIERKRVEACEGFS